MDASRSRICLALKPASMMQAGFSDLEVGTIAAGSAAQNREVNRHPAIEPSIRPAQQQKSPMGLA